MSVSSPHLSHCLSASSFSLPCSALWSPTLPSVQVPLSDPAFTASCPPSLTRVSSLHQPTGDSTQCCTTTQAQSDRVLESHLLTNSLFNFSQATGSAASKDEVRHSYLAGAHCPHTHRWLGGNSSQCMAWCCWWHMRQSMAVWCS